eukprot:TRINITY_DN11224_c0_g1_i1.p1 TRINITY_DN11224_c0_g1~~TRINITY_DN11224_c0_g1_i1.p1  ORF type:complete len:585 (-),score=114.77 TRINITY_DN11224_c0_g1_i1:47-1801(-)
MDAAVSTVTASTLQIIVNGQALASMQPPQGPPYRLLSGSSLFEPISLSSESFSAQQSPLNKPVSDRILGLLRAVDPDTPVPLRPGGHRVSIRLDRRTANSILTKLRGAIRGDPDFAFVQELRVSGVITKNHEKFLDFILKSPNHLHSFGLTILFGSNPMLWNRLGPLLVENTTLQEFRLTSRLQEGSTKHQGVLANVLRKNTSLKCIDYSIGAHAVEDWMSVAEALKTNKTLERLILRNNFISEEEGIAFADALRQNTTLNSFILDTNQTTFGRAFVKVGDALRVNHSLERLSLRGCAIDTKSFKDFINSVKQNSNLTSLSLVDCLLNAPDSLKEIASWIQHSTLTSLDLSNNRILGLSGMAEFCQSARNILDLNLESCGVDNFGAASISEMLKHGRMQVLRLGKNKFDSNGAELIAEGIRATGCTDLRVLSLNNIKIGRKCLEVLCGVLGEETCSVEYLDLSQCGLADDFSDSLYEYLGNKELPMHLNLSMNDLNAEKMLGRLERNKSASLMHFNFGLGNGRLDELTAVNRSAQSRKIVDLIWAGVRKCGPLESKLLGLIWSYSQEWFDLWMDKTTEPSLSTL